MPWIYLVLVAVVLVVGLGVLLLNRRRAARPEAAAPTVPVDEIDRPPGSRPGSASTTTVVEPVPVVDTPVDVGIVVEEPVEAVQVDEAPIVKPTFRERMAKARSTLAGTFLGIRARTGITDETWDDLEEALLRADVGVGVTEALLDPLRAKVKAKEITDPDDLVDALRDQMAGRLAAAARELRFEPATEGADGPNVWLFVGVNGVGKTTTIGKVAAQQRAEGRSVLLAAGDTFRAAAAEQLGMWAERSGAEMVRGNEGGDPSAVIFDAVERATSRHIDLVLGDTAGRLHTKTNLMEELSKVRRVASKGAGRVTEVLLVIDATTGQNGLTQAREFGSATAVAGGGAGQRSATPGAAATSNGSGITGVVLTKLDGSAKGGIVFAIETELGIPVKLVGLGEQLDDLVVFDPQEFVDALF